MDPLYRSQDSLRENACTFFLRQIIYVICSNKYGHWAVSCTIGFCFENLSVFLRVMYTIRLFNPNPYSWGAIHSSAAGMLPVGVPQPKLMDEFHPNFQDMFTTKWYRADYYLRQGGIKFATVCLSVLPSVC